MLKKSEVENSLYARELTKDYLYRITAKALANLEAYPNGFSPAEIWMHTRNFLSELGTVDKESRKAFLQELSHTYHMKLSQIERNGTTICRSKDEVDATMTCIFYCAQLRLFSSSSSYEDNPNSALIDELTEAMAIMNHPILKVMYCVVKEEEEAYARLYGEEPFILSDPFEEYNPVSDSDIERVCNHYAQRIERYLDKDHVEAFFSLWEKILDDEKICEALKEDRTVSGDEHIELNTVFNAKLLFNIYGMLFRRGFFVSSIRGETPLAALLTTHYDISKGKKVKAIYSYFRSESAVVKKQFIGSAEDVMDSIIRLIESL